MFEWIYSILLWGYDQTQCLAIPLDEFTRMCPANNALVALELCFIGFFIVIVAYAVEEIVKWWGDNVN